jgi:hypothetical protein
MLVLVIGCSLEMDMGRILRSRTGSFKKILREKLDAEMATATFSSGSG